MFILVVPPLHSMLVNLPWDLHTAKLFNNENCKLLRLFKVKLFNTAVRNKSLQVCLVNIVVAVLLIGVGRVKFSKRVQIERILNDSVNIFIVLF